MPAPAAERGRVRQVLSKISRFEDNPAATGANRTRTGTRQSWASRRRRGSGSPGPTADRLTATYPSSRSSWLRGSSDSQPAAAGNPSPFDGIEYPWGFRIATFPDTPRYARVDNAGQVVSFVTPGPGVLNCSLTSAARLGFA